MAYSMENVVPSLLERIDHLYQDPHIENQITSNSKCNSRKSSYVTPKKEVQKENSSEYNLNGIFGKAKAQDHQPESSDRQQ